MSRRLSKGKSLLGPLAAAVALLLARPGPVWAAETYYLLMFGAQRTPSNPNYSHTFATCVKATWPDTPTCAPPRLEAHTVSWLPRNMVVRTLAVLPECGANFDLHTTLRWCQGNGMRVSLWGAYQVRPQLYHRALRRLAALQSGRVLYKANDALRRDDEVSNCIHAVSAIAEGPRLTVLSPGWGEPASFFVLQEFEPWVLGCCRHPWVGSALGLDRHPIIYRDWERPLSGTFVGPVYRALGGERDVVASYGPPPR